jgi:hypothetical protein
MRKKRRRRQHQPKGAVAAELRSLLLPLKRMMRKVVLR